MSNANNTRSKVMTAAWAIFRKGGKTFSESLSAAWAAHNNAANQDITVKYRLDGDAADIAKEYAPNAEAVVFTRFEPRGSTFCPARDLDNLTGRVYLVPTSRNDGFTAYHYPQKETARTSAKDSRSKAQKFDDLYNEGVYGQGNYNPYR